MTDSSTDAQDVHERLQQLRASLLRHLSNGNFTTRELHLIRAERDALGLRPEAVRTLRSDIFHVAYRQANSDGSLSLQQADDLDRLMHFFNDPSPDDSSQGGR